MVIGEHMSSSYVNMPVRIMIHTGQLYDKWIKMSGSENLLYRSKLLEMPTPAYAIFYNGTKKMPLKETLKLSSAYSHPRIEGTGMLELEIPVYNVNKGMECGLFERSPHLKQYSEFVGKLREIEAHATSFSEAVDETLEHCIANNILASFLKKQGGRLVSILQEYSAEKHRLIYGEEERAEGRAEGRAEVRLEIARILKEAGNDWAFVKTTTGLADEQLKLVFD